MADKIEYIPREENGVKFLEKRVKHDTGAGCRLADIQYIRKLEKHPQKEPKEKSSSDGEYKYARFKATNLRCPKCGKNQMTAFWRGRMPLVITYMHLNVKDQSVCHLQHSVMHRAYTGCLKFGMKKVNIFRPAFVEEVFGPLMEPEYKYGLYFDIALRLKNEKRLKNEEVEKEENFYKKLRLYWRAIYKEYRKDPEKFFIEFMDDFKIVEKYGDCKGFRNRYNEAF